LVRSFSIHSQHAGGGGSGGSALDSSEERLARVLLLLANFGKEGKPELMIPKIIGTTRSRVSFFMNKFRKLGFIHYNGGLQIHSSLLNVILRD
jgi:CRP/FNR family cyclic AMP-dependent transcriptional regulator